MADVKIVVNRQAVRDLLRSDGVQRDLERRARNIAAAAGSEGDVEYEVQMFVGTNRARATVRTATHEARYLEATERRLSRAVDAGRDDG